MIRRVIWRSSRPPSRTRAEPPQPQSAAVGSEGIRHRHVRDARKLDLTGCDRQRPTAVAIPHGREAPQRQHVGAVRLLEEQVTHVRAAVHVHAQRSQAGAAALVADQPQQVPRPL